MKRIHLFEFEDFEWFPDWIRQCMTRLLVVMHKFLGSSDELAILLGKALQHTTTPAIVDLCSGSGGPVIDAYEKLKSNHPEAGLTLTLTDLYPNKAMAEQLNRHPNSGIRYITEPVDAAHVDAGIKGVRTMVSSLHHMKPEVARSILRNAQENRQPICIFEISDNSFPKWLWWVAVPFNMLTALFITPLARPMTWQQLAFTYLIPIIPLCFAWDGAVSNARTYTLEDMDILLQGLETDDYKWEKGRIEGRSKKLYLLGLPSKLSTS